MTTKGYFYLSNDELEKRFETAIRKRDECYFKLKKYEEKVKQLEDEMIRRKLA